MIGGHAMASYHSRRGHSRTDMSQQKRSSKRTTGCPSASSSQAPSLPSGSISPSCCAKVDRGASCVTTCTTARFQHVTSTMDKRHVS